MPTPTIDPSLLPPLLRALVQAIGLGPAMRLLEARGGTRIRIGQSPSDCQALAEILQPDEVAAVVRIWAGTRKDLPKLNKTLAQLRDLAIQADQRPLAEIARDYGLTMRWVRFIRNDERYERLQSGDPTKPRDDGQLGLF